MRLFIAEEPSLAKAIISALPLPHKRIENGNAVKCGDDDVVSWTAGHALNSAPPSAYKAEYENWALSDLPIIPKVWKQEVIKLKLFSTIKKLVSTCSLIVHAGDPDPEGQFIIDEILDYIENTTPVKRILVTDRTLVAIKASLADLRDNSDFRSLYLSRLAGSRADWLYGLNMTRLYTLLGKAGGFNSVLSVGRVQIPLLGLIVSREKQITSFLSKPFYDISLTITAASGSFDSNWQPGPSAVAFLDSEGRLIDLEFAQALVNKLTDSSGSILNIDISPKKSKQPLPFSLNGKTGIQLAAAKAFDYSPKQVLDACQTLHINELASYPRSDCPYLPEGHFIHAPDIIDAIKSNLPDLSDVAEGTDITIRSSAWNTKKIGAHYAVTPTKLTRDISFLNTIELNIYRLICERYLIQFYPLHEYNETLVTSQFGDELFKNKTTVVSVPGWKAALDLLPEDQDVPLSLSENLSLHVGDTVSTGSPILESLKTAPPQRFSNITIGMAMTGIAKFVSNPKIKALLNESAGIGTPATQASIIEILFDRGYIAKKGKSIFPTDLGLFMIEVLPSVATTPDMTAYWQFGMNSIASNDLSMDSFLEGVESQLSKLISSGKALEKLSIPGLKDHACTASGCDGFLKSISVKGKKKKFWGCSDYPDCSVSFPDKAGKPDFQSAVTVPCPNCSDGQLRKIKGANGLFWGCSNYKENCRSSFKNSRNKPVLPLK